MASKPDYLAKDIKKYLQPELEKRGFKRLNRKREFVRERGDFIDSFFFQLSRWGSKSFYVHVSTHLSFDPSNTFESFGYLWGERFEEPDWNASTEQNSKTSIQEVVSKLDTEILIWFERYNCIKDASIELLLDDHRKEENMLRLAFLMAKLDRYVGMRKFAGPVIRRKPEESDEPDYCKQQGEIAYDLIKSYNAGTLEQFLESFRDVSRSACGLD